MIKYRMRNAQFWIWMARVEKRFYEFYSIWECTTILPWSPELSDFYSGISHKDKKSYKHSNKYDNIKYIIKI